MIEPQPLQHHITRREDPLRLCGRQPAGEEDLLTTDIDGIRKARGEATLCPHCQEKSGYPPFHLTPPRMVYGNQTLAYLYATPVQDRFDAVRNCPHCRERPGERTCRAWNNLAKSVMALRQEATATGGCPATLYRFVDGSVGYLAPEAPYWQEAGEVTGRALENAFRVLEARRDLPRTRPRVNTGAACPPAAQTVA